VQERGEKKKKGAPSVQFSETLPTFSVPCPGEGKKKRREESKPSKAPLAGEEKKKKKEGRPVHPFPGKNFGLKKKRGGEKREHGVPRVALRSPGDARKKKKRKRN